MTGGSRGFDLQQQRITVTVNVYIAQIEVVPRSITFAPVLLSGTRPESDPALLQGAGQSLVIHVAQHQHPLGMHVLNNRGEEPRGVTFEPLGHCLG